MGQQVPKMQAVRPSRWVPCGYCGRHGDPGLPCEGCGAIVRYAALPPKPVQPASRQETGLTAAQIAGDVFLLVVIVGLAVICFWGASR